jgi:Ca2+-binding RTX toxin-like protein
MPQTVSLDTGPQEFGFTGAEVPTTTIGSGPDTLLLSIWQNAYLGDAAFTVSVDGHQIGGRLSAGAVDTLAVLGDFGPSGPAVLTVDFLNDAYGGSSAADRNLFVSVLGYNGAAVPDSGLALYGNGPQSINFRPIDGTPGDDVLAGTSGNDRIFGGDGDDRIAGRDGRDQVHGGNGGDTLRGGREDDRIFGDPGDDRLSGGAGYDRLDGGPGNDTLIGGAWADELTGGPGADCFVYRAVSDSRVLTGPDQRDLIRDFSRAEGDRIDLSGIDADATLPGRQAFVFVSEPGGQPGRGELSVFTVSLVLRTFVVANVDDDPAPDLQILLDGLIPFTAGDFIL